MLQVLHTALLSYCLVAYPVWVIHRTSRRRVACILAMGRFTSCTSTFDWVLKEVLALLENHVSRECRLEINEAHLSRVRS